MEFLRAFRRLDLDQEKMERGDVLTKSLLVDEEKAYKDSATCHSSATAVAVFSTLAATCSSTCAGAAFAYSSPAQSGIMRDLGLSIADYSTFGSIMTIGALIGAFLSGRMVASFGHKHAMRIAGLFGIIGWLAIALAKDSWWLYSGRVLLGQSVAIFVYAAPVYIAETSPKDLRGAFSFTTQLMRLMTNTGLGIVYFIGNLVSWRTLALIGVIPFVVQFIGLFFIPSSPRWLAMVGQNEECGAALQRLRGDQADISEKLDEIMASLKESRQHPTERISDLFQKKYLYPVIVGIGLILLQNLGGANGVAFYASSVFEQSGSSTSIGTTIIAAIQIPVAIVGIYLMDRAGRRTLLMISAAGMCLGSFLVGITFLLQLIGYWNCPIMALIGIMGYMTAFPLGMAGIPLILVSEIFPVNVKASAGTLAGLVLGSGAFIVAYAFNFMMEWSRAGTFFIFSSICAFTVLFVWKLVPEIKGKTLEQMQASLCN